MNLPVGFGVAVATGLAAGVAAGLGVAAGVAEAGMPAKPRSRSSIIF